jgi:hypothetical protein
MPFKSGQVVLVDTNVIIAAHRAACWNALAGYFSVQTVEECVKETQTGYQNRSPEESIDRASLMKALKHVAPVSQLEKAHLMLRCADIGALDPGERDLLAHAVARTDTWLLCGPDKATIRAAHEMGLIDQIVSLERLVEAAGVGAKQIARLPANFREAWLSGCRNELAAMAIRSKT